MKVLIVAATEAEIGGLLSVAGGGERVAGAQSGEFLRLTDNLSVLITGVGMVATAFALGRHLATHSYNLLLNLGIAGSFDRSIPLGEVAEITEDTFSELGAEDDEQFISINQLGFGEAFFTATGKLSDYTNEPIPQVSAVTVNTVHGNEHSIGRLARRLSVQLESMEGAAFFYTATQLGMPALQIRAVSNYVEKRNRDTWKIGLAVKNLNTFAVDFINRLKSENRN